VKKVLTIAGSDPSGGAGIQADLRVFDSIGVTGLSAISAVTIQNSRGVKSIYPVPPDTLAGQIETILEDCAVDAVKIGMLGTAEHVRVVREILLNFLPDNIVLDPILSSSDGATLLEEAGIELLRTQLFPICDVITPNRQEAERLSGIAIHTEEDACRAATMLLKTGAKAVLVKGGHLPGNPVDVLVQRGAAPVYFRHPRIETFHTHGTGCFLSSGIAANLALNVSYVEAVRDSIERLQRGLKHPVIAGEGRGYPDPFSAAGIKTPETHRQRLSRLQGVYVITHPDRGHIPVFQAAIEGGAKVVQFRDKRLSTLERFQIARQMSEQKKEALFIVNDDPLMSLAVGADGVHVGPEDISPEEARKIMGSDLIVGVSVSNLTEAERCAEYASYFGVGAVFGSVTKEDAGLPVGVKRIAEIKSAYPDIPLVAIGGITWDNIAQVAEAGADAAAVISAITRAEDMTAAVRLLSERFAKGQNQRRSLDS
jgi:hydroxymethylpyrimidine kinase/phosphomethylpyrimidine kinase/thiamine-phosphate diphosphorylase